MKTSIQWGKALFILAIYAVLFLFFVTNALAMTGYDFVPSVCIARLAAIAATALVARYYSKAVIPLSSAMDSGNKRERAIYLGGTFALGIIALFPYYIAYFPGGFGADCRYQLSQALTGKYNDWHSPIQTMIFYTIPLKLFRHVEMLVPFQILCFSASFAYLVWTMRKARCPGIVCAITAVIVLLSPITGRISCQLYKDCGFAILATLVTALYINIVDTHGMWLKSKANIALFAVSAALCTMMRHNGILYTLPLLGAVLFFAVKQRRAAVIAAALSFVIMAGIKWPLYRVFRVTHEKTPVVEVTGLCMSIMGRALMTDSESLDDEVRDFLYKVADKDVWEALFKDGFADMKWEDGVDMSVLDPVGAKAVLKYTLMTIRTHPMSSLKEFLWRIRFVYQMDGKVTRDVIISAATDLTSVRVPSVLSRFAYQLVRLWRTGVQHTILKWPFYFYVGWADALMIIVAIIRIYRDKDFSPCLHVLPLLCYNAGTALLLVSNSFRYFYYTLPIFIPILFISLRQEPEGGNQ